MPKQNRVTPFGAIITTPERGTFLGNRGLLHDHEENIRRAWQVKRWLLCLLEFKSRRREIMRPGYYTELFFLDEATGLAAGHRPCAECRRERFKAFCKTWLVGKGDNLGAEKLTATALDEQLHTERVAPGGLQRSFLANLDDLPDGVFVTREESVGRAYLLWTDHLLLWSPGGYLEQLPRPQGEQVSVLTPRSTVEAIRAGYVPEVHATACNIRV